MGKSLSRFDSLMHARSIAPSFPAYPLVVDKQSSFHWRHTHRTWPRKSNINVEGVVGLSFSSGLYKMLWKSMVALCRGECGSLFNETMPFCFPAILCAWVGAFGMSQIPSLLQGVELLIGNDKKKHRLRYQSAARKVVFSSTVFHTKGSG